METITEIIRSTPAATNRNACEISSYRDMSDPSDKMLYTKMPAFTKSTCIPTPPPADEWRTTNIYDPQWDIILTIPSKEEGRPFLYHVQSSKLACVSPFFKALLRGTWAEREPSDNRLQRGKWRVELQDVDPASLDILMEAAHASDDSQLNYMDISSIDELHNLLWNAKYLVITSVLSRWAGRWLHSSLSQHEGTEDIVRKGGETTQKALFIARELGDEKLFRFCMTQIIYNARLSKSSGPTTHSRVVDVDGTLIGDYSNPIHQDFETIIAAERKSLIDRLFQELGNTYRAFYFDDQRPRECTIVGHSFPNETCHSLNLKLFTQWGTSRGLISKPYEMGKGSWDGSVVELIREMASLREYTFNTTATTSSTSGKTDTPKTSTYHGKDMWYAPCNRHNRDFRIRIKKWESTAADLLQMRTPAAVAMLEAFHRRGKEMNTLITLDAGSLECVPEWATRASLPILPIDPPTSTFFRHELTECADRTMSEGLLPARIEKGRLESTTPNNLAGVRA